VHHSVPDYVMTDIIQIENSQLHIYITAGNNNAPGECKYHKYPGYKPVSGGSTLVFIKATFIDRFKPHLALGNAMCTVHCGSGLP
jgi:hypothetical protein